MRMKGKKYIFDTKDCWSLTDTLNPILSAALIKYKSELIRLRDEDHPFRGIPSGIGEYKEESDFEDIYQSWIDIVGEMVYAFSAEAPDYTGKWIEGTEHGKPADETTGSMFWDLIPKDPAAYNKFLVQTREHELRVVEGRQLFAKHYDNLWW